jgi:hypothetical protein
MDERYQLAIHRASLDNCGMSAGVGADVESICTKCGDVWHVVVAKVGDKIAKVQCKECHSFHRYKPPGGKSSGKLASKSTRAAASSTSATKSTKSTKSTPAARARKATAAPPPPSVAPDLGRPVRRYLASEAFTAGDRVQHATFGLGVVQSSPGPGKIDVAFPGGRRILAQARGEMGLARPTNNFDD